MNTIKGIFQKAAHYVMQGRQQAVIAGLLFTITPLFGWVSNVIIALVTLRKGPKEGLITLLWISLPIVVVAGVVNPWIALYNLGGGSVLTYLFAYVLWQTQSWKFTLEVGLILGLLLVGLLHVWLPDVSAFWTARLAHYVPMMKDQFGMTLDENQIRLFSPYGSGLQYSFFWTSALLNLVMARAVHSFLYQPGQCAAELKTIQLSPWSAFLLCGLAIASFQKVVIAQDMLPIVGLTFVFAGLSLFHAWAGVRWRFSKTAFILFYLLLVIFFPYVATALMLLALIDAFFNLRERALFKKNK